MQLTFDTKQIYRDLSSEGLFSKEQADALTNKLRDVVTFNSENLATKDDVKSSENQLRTEIKSVEEGLKAELKILKRDLMIFTGASVAAGITILGTLLQMFG